MPKSPNTPRILWALLIVSLFLNVAAAVIAGKRYLKKSTQSAYVPPPKLPYYLSRDQLFEAMPPDTGAVIFLGNSLTQYYELAEFFPEHRIKNRGIHGDMMEKVLHRLSPIIGSKPRKIFIELGVNDIEQQMPKEKFLTLYARLLDTLIAACPSASIYVQSLLPVADTSVYLPVTYCSRQMNQKIASINPELQNLAEEKGCKFINLHEAFVRNGQLPSAYSVDGLHLSGEGYRLWTKLLKPYVGD